MAEPQSNLDSIFLSALEIASSEARAAFLTEACGGDAALRYEVEKLLAAHVKAGSFLEQPARELAATIVPGSTQVNITRVMDAGLASAFGEDEAVVIGRSGHQAVQALGQTVNIPRVVLRDADEGAGQQVQPLSSEMPGRHDSRYELEGEIARGGMGAIIKGRDVDLGRELAIKVLLDAHKDRPEVVQRFIEEAQIGGQLQHPGIAPVYELGQFADRRPYFSMKLVKGETLASLLANRAEPAVDRAKFLGIFEQVCQTMAYAHSRGVLHRDLKPTNVMVGAFGEVQVMDWGLAKVLTANHPTENPRESFDQNKSHAVQTLRSGVGSDVAGPRLSASSHTQVGSVMGTPAYMPPEQAHGEVNQLDERADVFGLGAILCEILTGFPPYVGENGTIVYRRAARGDLGDCFARIERCGADNDLIVLTKECLAADPQLRPRNASALAQRISGYLQSVQAKLHETETERAVQAARVVQQRQAARKLQKMIVGLAAVALVAVATSLVAMKFWQDAAIAQRSAELSERNATQHAALATRNAETANREAQRANNQTRLAEEHLLQAQLAQAEADSLRKQADHEAEVAQQNLYYAQMHLALQTWHEHRSLNRTHDLLLSWLPQGDKHDLRGWEWFYLRSLSFQNMSPLAFPETTDSATHVQWHVATNRLADGNSSGRIRIWDTERERVLLTFTAPAPSFAYWCRKWLHWSPDGTKLATASGSGVICIWDAKTGQKLHESVGTNVPCISVVFSAESNRIAGWFADGRVQIWSLEPFQLLSGMGVSGWAQVGAWSPDNQRLVTGYQDGSVVILDASTGLTISTLREHKGAIHALAWSPDSKKLATGSYDHAIYIWDAEQGTKLIGPMQHSHEVMSLDWEANGKRLASGSLDDTIKVWNPVSGQETLTLRGNTNMVTGVTWGDRGRLASACNQQSVRIWETNRDQEVNRLPSHQGRATAVRWSPDGRQFATGGDDGCIRIWDAVTRAKIREIKAFDSQHTSPQFGLMRSLEWHPAGKQLAASGMAGGAKVWDVATGEEVYAPRVDHGPVWSVAWSKDGQHLAWGSNDGTVSIAAGTPLQAEVRSFRSHQSPIRAIAWHPQGDRLAVSAWGSDVIKIWDFQGVEQGQLTGHTAFALSWSPDGQTLASAGADFRLLTWDAQTLQQRQSFSGHSDFVDGICWNPSGDRLASASIDGTVRIWDPQTGTESFALRGTAGTYHSIAWHPAGAQLAAIGDDGHVWLWDATRGFLFDSTPQSLPYVGLLAATGELRGALRGIGADTYVRHGRIADALQLLRDDPPSLALQFNKLWTMGAMPADEQTLTSIREKLEQHLAADPHDKEVTLALANILLSNSHAPFATIPAANWKSRDGATMTLEQDASTVVSGKHSKGDVYSLTFDSTHDSLACLRLEALPQAGLPQKGPGRHITGNFHLSAVRLYRLSADGKQRTRLPLDDVWASFAFEAQDADIRGIIDENLHKFWHVWGQMGNAHEAIFHLATPAKLEPGEQFVLELVHSEDKDAPANLGRFRVSLSSDPHALKREQDHDRLMKVIQATSTASDRLAGAYWLLQDQAALDKVLSQHPEATEVIANLHAYNNEDEQAVAVLNQALTTATSNANLFARRGKLHARAQQWELAEADWQRATELAPDHLPAAYACFVEQQRWKTALMFGQQQIARDPNNTLFWIKVVPTAYNTGDAQAYRQFCQQIVKLAGDDPTAETNERFTKACLIMPGVFDLAELPQLKFNQAFVQGGFPPYLTPWIWNTRALLAYRQGDAKLAVACVLQSERHQPLPPTHGLNLAVLALAEQKLNHVDKYQQYLAEARPLLAQLQATPNPDVQMFEILLREAEEAFNAKQK